MDRSLEAYLETLGCELWPGEAFYLTDPESRNKAAKWLRDMNNGYAKWSVDQGAKLSSGSWEGPPTEPNW